MRRSATVFGMLLCFLPLMNAQKHRSEQAPTPPNFADFPIRVHISASYLRLNCNDIGFNKVTCRYGLYAEAILEGKKVELWGESKIGKYQLALLAPGDYMAQLMKDDHNPDQSVLSRSYEFLLPDGTGWQCQLSGITE